MLSLLKLYVCGGYDDQTDRYLTMCQNYSQKGVPWSKDCVVCKPEEGNFNQKRAFHSMVVVEKENGEEVMLALGGYNGDSFLGSVEKFDPTGLGSWEVVTSMKMNESRAHFCSVYYKV